MMEADALTESAVDLMEAKTSAAERSTALWVGDLSGACLRQLEGEGQTFGAGLS